MPTFTATTALPFPRTDRAVMGLRAMLRQEFAAAGAPSPVDWADMVVSGPVEHADAKGHTWYGWSATITSGDAAQSVSNQRTFG